MSKVMILLSAASFITSKLLCLQAYPVDSQLTRTPNSEPFRTDHKSLLCAKMSYHWFKNILIEKKGSFCVKSEKFISQSKRQGNGLNVCLHLLGRSFLKMRFLHEISEILPGTVRIMLKVPKLVESLLHVTFNVVSSSRLCK